MHRDPLTTEQRLTRLERSLHRWRALALGLAGLAIVGWSLPSAPEDLIQARRIELVDEAGAARILMWHDSTGTGIYLRDDAGDTRVGLGHFAHGGSGVALHGPGGRGGTVLYLKGTGSLTFYDTTGAVRGRVAEEPR